MKKTLTTEKQNMHIDHQLRQMVNTFGEERVRDSLKNLAEIEADKCRFEIRKVREKVAVFEDRFHKTSENAWEEYNQGLLGDDMDITEWMAFYENLPDFQANSKRILLSQAGALSDYDSLDKLRQMIYSERRRPEIP